MLLRRDSASSRTLARRDSRRCCQPAHPRRRAHPDTEVFEHPADFGIEILGLDNDHVQYTVDRGMQPEEASLLKNCSPATTTAR